MQKITDSLVTTCYIIITFLSLCPSNYSLSILCYFARISILTQMNINLIGINIIQTEVLLIIPPKNF